VHVAKMLIQQGPNFGPAEVVQADVHLRNGWGCGSGADERGRRPATGRRGLEAHGSAWAAVPNDLSDCGSPRYTTWLPGARLSCMNARVDHLLHEALELPDDERSALVAALLDSLEGSADPSISEAWREELRTRRKALRDGSIQATPWTSAKTGGR
jgi:putative addiction module component (TIGR02574 family)